MLLACGLAESVPGRGRAESLYRLVGDSPAPWQDVGVPHSAPDVLTRSLSRRRFVAVTAGATALAATAGGCSLPATIGEPDPLTELAEAAHRDSLQFAAADVSHGDRVQALHRLAEVRRVHAERLDQSVEPLAADVTSSSGEAPEAQIVCPPLAEVLSRLRSDAIRAAKVAVDVEGTRAELAASVSAACIAAVEVVLA